MKEPIRVLNITRVFQAAGIESFIMNVYRNIDRDKVQFDFMITKNEVECYDQEIADLGGKKYSIEVKGNNSFFCILKESIGLYKFLKRHTYKVIHVHYTTPLRATYLLAAKLAGVPVRIYHSHSAEVSGKSHIKLLVYNFFRKKIEKWGTHWFACSQAAALWMYTKSVIDNRKACIIYNGIDVKRFEFNKDKRSLIRSELGIDDKFVLIHTGRFLEQKNHPFLIDILFEIRKRYRDVKLLLLGNGKLMNDVKKKVKDYGLEGDVVFLGIKSNVEDYLSAADCYVMPSLYEGLPVAAVEAQCSGLPCVLSDSITKEVALNDDLIFLSLRDSIDIWVNTILAYKVFNRSGKSNIVAKRGYDINLVAKQIEHFYLSN